MINQLVHYCGVATSGAKAVSDLSMSAGKPNFAELRTVDG